MNTFNARAEQLSEILKVMEQDAPSEQLFALGYIIPQLTLVAEYDEAQENFDQSFSQWLDKVFQEDQLSEEDQLEITTLWQQAIAIADTPAN